MSHATSSANISAMIAQCQEQDKLLNDWERSFISSIAEQYTEKGTLSPRQLAKLTDIHSKMEHKENSQTEEEYPDNYFTDDYAERNYDV